MHFNTKVIINILSILIFSLGLFMLLSLPVALIYMSDGGGINEMAGFVELLIPALGSLIVGAVAWLLTKNNNRKLNKRDGYLIVSLGWIIMSLLGALPFFLLGGQFTNMADAIFESVSGFTTTGASILTDIEVQPKAILFWRSMTQWIGGMGIIVLAIAILPFLGIGGMQLFVAEAPGPTADKLHPRITETAKRLWFIYVGLTFTQTIILLIFGMSLFDALTHSFTTISTGGFSTKNASVAHFAPAIQYTIVMFMFLSGMNFSLTYFGLKGKLRKIWKNEEFRAYLFLVLSVTFLATFIVFTYDPQKVNVGFEEAFRDSIFQVVSVMTTTGFITENFAQWGVFLKVIFFLLLFFGASAGSTAGGIKVVRIILILKNGFIEFKRQLHPNAILPVRYSGKIVDNQIVFNVLAFFMIYMFVYCLGCLILASNGHDFETVMSSVATSLGNVGPGLGKVDPVCNFSFFGPVQKLLLAFLMLLGRLELFTIMILFTPYYWKKY